jgi:hypothetical protein
MKGDKKPNKKGEKTIKTKTQKAKWTNKKKK